MKPLLPLLLLLCLSPLAAQAQARTDLFAYGIRGSSSAWTPPGSLMLWTTFDDCRRLTNSNVAFTNSFFYADRVSGVYPTTQQDSRWILCGYNQTDPGVARTNSEASGNTVGVTTNATAGGFCIPMNYNYAVTSSNAPMAPWGVAFWSYTVTPADGVYFDRENIGLTLGKPLLDRSANKLRLVASPSTFNNSANYDIPSNQWTHIALTCETNTSATNIIFKVYANSELKITATQNCIFAATDPIAFHQRAGRTYAFKGRIDDVVIVSNLWSAADIANLYGRGAPDTRSGP